MAPGALRDRRIELLDAAFADVEAPEPGTAATTDPGPTSAVVHRALRAIAQLAAMLDARRVACVQVLEQCSWQPVSDLASGLRTTRREAGEVVRRSDTLRKAPQLGEALAAGEIGSGHVDRLSGSLARLDPAQRRELLSGEAALVGVAREVGVEEFDRYLREQERRVQADDGQGRLERQRRAVRLRTGIDRETGMARWTLVVDPATALGLDGRVRAITESRFHGGLIPAEAPDDPIERDQFLRAHGLIELINGGGMRMGRPEIVVVEDRRVPPGTPPRIDWGLPVELPVAELERLRQRADVRHVVFDGDTLVSAPGQMNHGRARRLATADQRRVLRAWYARCAIPDCEARFDRCTIHHVVEWQPPDLGPTDLDNLLPLCTRHHHQVHDAGWRLALDPDRTLTIAHPTGAIVTAGPNRRAGPRTGGP